MTVPEPPGRPDPAAPDRRAGPAEPPLPPALDESFSSVDAYNDILATISHELRTPITTALGNIDLARRSLDRQQLDRLPQRLLAAREALTRLARLTDDLVGASRNGLPLLVLAPVQAGTVLQHACATVRPLADEQQITLASEDIGACGAIGDAGALLTVFGNLLSNAIRYTPEGGRVEARCGESDGWVWLSIADSGIGMTTETQARIFERFYRNPEARRAEPRGLGLGLSIAQRLVAAHHAAWTSRASRGRAARSGSGSRAPERHATVVPSSHHERATSPFDAH